MLKKEEFIPCQGDGSRSANGGDYSYTTTVFFEGGKPVMLVEDTSSDIDYCNRCGTFNADCDCSETVSAEWMADRVKNGKFGFFEEASDWEIRRARNWGLRAK